MKGPIIAIGIGYSGCMFSIKDLAIYQAIVSIIKHQGVKTSDLYFKLIRIKALNLLKTYFKHLTQTFKLLYFYEGNFKGQLLNVHIVLCNGT